MRASTRFVQIVTVVGLATTGGRTGCPGQVSDPAKGRTTAPSSTFSTGWVLAPRLATSIASAQAGWPPTSISSFSLSESTTPPWRRGWRRSKRCRRARRRWRGSTTCRRRWPDANCSGSRPRRMPAQPRSGDDRAATGRRRSTSGAERNDDAGAGRGRPHGTSGLDRADAGQDPPRRLQRPPARRSDGGLLVQPLQRLLGQRVRCASTSTSTSVMRSGRTCSARFASCCRRRPKVRRCSSISTTGRARRPKARHRRAAASRMAG